MFIFPLSQLLRLICAEHRTSFLYKREDQPATPRKSAHSEAALAWVRAARDARRQAAPGLRTQAKAASE